MIKEFTGTVPDMPWALFKRGLASFGATEEQMEATLLDYLDNHLILTGPHSFALIWLPEASSIDQIPQIMHFYNEGGRAETSALRDAVLNSVKEKGYNTFRAVNGSGRRDDAWLRIFRHKDWNIKPVKTVFEFEARNV